MIYGVSAGVINEIADVGLGDDSAVWLLHIPLFWFMLAQGTKRCHDLGNSGWWQLILFYGIWMLFEDGQSFTNEYGENPKQVSLAAPDVVPEAGADESNHSGLPTLQATQSVEPVIPQQPEKQQATVSREERTDGLQMTELEIQNVNYGLLQEVLRTLRSLKLVQSIFYEFNGTVGKALIKHECSSQDLLDELYNVVQSMEVLSVANGSLKIRLK